MIPIFPKFKKLTLEDRVEVNSYTQKFEPYSDFNFISLWVWDTNKELQVSILNSNLVVIFSDYTNSEPFLSFIGKNEIGDTVEKLVSFAESKNISPVLKLIPDAVINYVRLSNFDIDEDPANFDYIYSCAELSGLKGARFKNKRQMAQKFIKDYPQAEFQVKKLGAKGIQKEVLSVLNQWEQNQSNQTNELLLEKSAIIRILELAKSEDTELMIASVSVADEVIGFSIDELLTGKQATSHFVKADVGYRGIYDFLNQQIAKYLLDSGITEWNWEQDLNIEGLRQSKTSYRPVRFLKKYKISRI